MLSDMLFVAALVLVVVSRRKDHLAAERSSI